MASIHRIHLDYVPNVAPKGTVYNDEHVEGLINLMTSLPQEYTFLQFWKIPEVQEAHRRMARACVPTLQPLEDPGTGDAIITAGGGPHYFPSLWVLLSRLKALRNTMPVEIWFLGEEELDPVMRRLLTGIGPWVELYDAKLLEKERRYRALKGWEMKAFAMLNSKRRRVLFLDADNAPIRNPQYVFSSPQFQEHGTVFWPDYPHWMLNEDQYRVFDCAAPANMDPPGNDYDMMGVPIPPENGWDLPVESGQILVDKAKAAVPLQLAAWYCQHSDFYFRHVHGDKECFHLAWRFLEAPYHIPMFWPDYDSTTCLQYDFDGNLLFAHRNKPEEKWKLKGNTRGRGLNPCEPDLFEYVEELKKVWTGKVWYNEQPSERERAEAKKLEHRKFFYYRIDPQIQEGKDVRLLQLGSGGIIKIGNDKNEQRWSVWLIDDEPVLSIVGDRGLTCNLRQAEDGSWRGRWVFGEQASIVLIDTAIVQPQGVPA